MRLDWEIHEVCPSTPEFANLTKLLNYLEINSWSVIQVLPETDLYHDRVVANRIPPPQQVQ